MIYKLRAACAREHEDEGCDLVFSDDVEAMALATSVAVKSAVRLEVWSGQRFVGRAELSR